MNFYTIRDLRTESKSLFETLSSDQEVIVTNNGKPAALMLNITPENFEEVLQAVRQAKATIAFNNMRRKAGEAGFMSEADIESEINAVRKEE